MAVTGQSADEGDAQQVVEKIRAVSDVPALVGIGITTPEQARQTSLVSDGVIVGSVLVKSILDGASVVDIEEHIRSFRNAIDTVN